MKDLHASRVALVALMLLPLLVLLFFRSPVESKPEAAKPGPKPRLIVHVQYPRPRELVRSDLAKFEPETGCYLGAYIDLADELKLTFTDQNDKDHKLPSEFEALVKKPHAIYFFYLGYGRPVPLDWLRYLVSRDKYVHVALEPNQGLDQVQDDEFLREVANDFRRSGARIFLRFASEMNGPWVKYHGDPEKYIEKWRLVTRVMRERAPNVAMVWCPYAMPISNIDDYYPGDEYVDWVGVNMYNVSYFNQDPSMPAVHYRPRDLLQPIYDKYSSRKPIMIGEYGTTHYSAVEDKPLIDFAVTNLRSLYRDLRERYPRVKAINYFNTNNLKLAHRKNNNYSVTHVPEVLDAYQDAIADDHFLTMPLSDGVGGPGLGVRPLKPRDQLSGRVRLSFWIDSKKRPDAITLSINGKPYFKGEHLRSWSTVLDASLLEPGDHQFQVRALDGNGREMAREDYVVRIGR